jgi:cobalt-zinc-cadmium efflux system membrane fusion protein
MKFRYIIFKMTLLWLGISITACKEKVQPSNEEASPEVVAPAEIELTGAQLANAKLSFTQLQEKMLPVEINLNGKVFTPASEKISVHVPMSGYIKSLPWIQGMSVKKGQVIAIVEDLAYLQIQQDYLQALSSLEMAEGEWNRQKQLLSTKATSEKSNLEAKNNFQRQKIEVAALRQKLKLIHIDPAGVSAEKLSSTIHLVSPVNGYVQAVNSNLGDYVSPQDELLTMVAVNEVTVSLNAFEKDLAGLKTGQTVIITSPSSVDKQYPAAVTQLGKSVNGQGNVEVICRVKGGLGLIEGQFVTGKLTLQSGVASCVPEKSLVHFEGKEFVFLKEGAQKFAMVEISAGIRSDDWVQVQNIAALKGKEVVVEGSYTLLMVLKNVEE